MLSGDEIKRIRLSRGLSLQNVADFCKCSKTTLSKIESFKLNPSEELYEKIIEAIYKLDDRTKEK